jgi:hypothetical protein
MDVLLVGSRGAETEILMCDAIPLQLPIPNRQDPAIRNFPKPDVAIRVCSFELGGLVAA